VVPGCARIGGLAVAKLNRSLDRTQMGENQCATRIEQAPRDLIPLGRKEHIDGASSRDCPGVLRTVLPLAGRGAEGFTGYFARQARITTTAPASKVSADKPDEGSISGTLTEAHEELGLAITSNAATASIGNTAFPNLLIGISSSELTFVRRRRPSTAPTNPNLDDTAGSVQEKES
jgi:hypothetical protein